MEVKGVVDKLVVEEVVVAEVEEDKSLVVDK